MRKSNKYEVKKKKKVKSAGVQQAPRVSPSGACMHPDTVSSTGLFRAPVAGPHTGHTTVKKVFNISL